MSTELVMPPNHLILCHPLLLLSSIVSQHQDFSNELALRIRWPKYWNCSFCISSFQWIFSFDFLKDCLVWSPCRPRTLKSPLQHHDLRESVLLVLSLLYGPTLTSVHDYWKKCSFDYMDIIALTMRTHSSDYENPMESMRRTGVSSLHVW